MTSPAPDGLDITNVTPSVLKAVSACSSMSIASNSNANLNADRPNRVGFERSTSSANQSNSNRMTYSLEKHPHHILETMNIMRAHRDLCDIMIHVGNRTIHAHKLVLASCSPYFRAMFTSEMIECKQTEIKIQDVDEDALATLIDFCYTAQIVIEESNVQILLPAACLLQLQEIQDICCDFLKKQLDPSNCLGIRAFADQHSCRDLLQIANKFTQRNFQEV